MWINTEILARLAHEYPELALSCHCTDPKKTEHFPGIEGIVGDLHIQGGRYGLARSAATFRSLGHQFWQRSCLELAFPARVFAPRDDRPAHALSLNRRASHKAENRALSNLRPRLAVHSRCAASVTPMRSGWLPAADRKPRH